MLDVLNQFGPTDELSRVTDLDSLADKRGLYVLCGPHSSEGAIEMLAGMAAGAEFTVVQ